ncbi:hypothetical protein DERP_006791 [Dermatophagoides pteronyssinus]|uniref:Uncharacterized protein n=1 Tax=Dermatophagoides pteronyssinus TaxID=6956 RepID=A0ABQ8IS03_DERPT|nr:hypothetical protein DERP_006791 [Dermatophagoides pteronyssinus]
MDFEIFFVDDDDIDAEDDVLIPEVAFTDVELETVDVVNVEIEHETAHIDVDSEISLSNFMPPTEIFVNTSSIHDEFDLESDRELHDVAVDEDDELEDLDSSSPDSSHDDDPEDDVDREEFLDVEHFDDLDLDDDNGDCEPEHDFLKIVVDHRWIKMTDHP